MVELQIVYWRDIPAQVIVRQARRTARRELPTRFIEAIDMCAMRVGAKDSETYLSEWRRSSTRIEGADLDAEAERAASQLEAAYGPDRLKALIENGGHET